MRILSMMRATKETEAGIPPSKELIERMGALVEEATKAGVLLSSDGLHPSSKGKRLKLENGKTTVIDGPFTESRELVASYALCQVKDMDEALMWCSRFLEVLGEGECELRPIFGPDDFSPDVLTPEQAAREAANREQMEQNARR